MRMTVLPVLFVGVFTSLSAVAASPSFNCAKATHEAEKLICKDAELASLDRDLAQLYAAVLKNTPARDQKLLKAEQRGWIKGRDDCWKSSDARGCIVEAYQDRTSELEAR